jgi:hypothetical protein
MRNIFGDRRIVPALSPGRSYSLVTQPLVARPGDLCGSAEPDRLDECIPNFLYIIKTDYVEGPTVKAPDELRIRWHRQTSPSRQVSTPGWLLACAARFPWQWGWHKLLHNCHTQEPRSIHHRISVFNVDTISFAQLLDLLAFPKNLSTELNDSSVQRVYISEALKG